MRQSNYDRHPSLAVPGGNRQVWSGWDAVVRELRRVVHRPSYDRAQACVVLAIECSTGLLPEVREQLRRMLTPATWIDAGDALIRPPSIDRVVAPWLGGGDPLFESPGTPTIDSLLHPGRLAAIRARIAVSLGLVVVFGTGALRCCDPDIIVYADMPRREGIRRQRQGRVANLGVHNAGHQASLQYTRSCFVDWLIVDHLKRQSLERWDYLLDSTQEGQPRLVTGDAVRLGLDRAAHQPFRLVPFFEPAPWGGPWMKDVCGLDASVPGYGWCVDCVPEENTLSFVFGNVNVEMSALNLVFAHPRELLGEHPYERFGAEFPMRVTLLDTMGGGNLSLLVHPMAACIHEPFGLACSQDERYYLLDAGPDASVFLGLRDDVIPQAMMDELQAAHRSGPTFDASRHVAIWPARRHDHFLIPAGTVHGAGANSMVLAVSATPRPSDLTHGPAIIQWDRRASQVREPLINRLEPVAKGAGWREERTNLHEPAVLDTCRYWFTGTAPHDTQGTVHVLNLVQGDEAVVESPDRAFPPFIVHYAETFVVPASVGPYTIRPHGSAAGTECATLRASIRNA